ncbi:N-acetyltransferase family protein [Streptococcus hongkongensis]|nr:GNAT family acetyltransferase [Streptococcus uberis]
MLIRPIQASDYQQVMAIENSVWNPYNSPVYGRLTTAKDLERSKKARSGILVAEENGTILACLSYNPMYPFEQGAHVVTFGLAVSNDYQGRGIGQAMLAHFFPIASAQGYKRITMHVTSGNDSAIKLYHKLGFKLEAQLTGHLIINGVPHDDLLFTKELEERDAR